MKQPLATRRQLLLTFVTCLLLGPPLGGFVSAIMLYLVPSDPVSPSAGLLKDLLSVAFTGLFSIPFSYLVGGVSALLSGLAMVAYAWAKGRPPLWFAVLVATVVFAFVQSYQNDQSSNAVTVLLAVHLVAGLACWFVLQRLWKSPA